MPEIVAEHTALADEEHQQLRLLVWSGAISCAHESSSSTTGGRTHLDGSLAHHERRHAQQTGSHRLHGAVQILHPEPASVVSFAFRR